MFNSTGVSGLQTAFNWIGQIINLRLPNMNITLWQFALGLFFFRVIFKLILSLMDTRIGGIGYRGSSYHGEDKYDYYRTIDDSKVGKDGYMYTQERRRTK